jgi:hypothetical protein
VLWHFNSNCKTSSTSYSTYKLTPIYSFVHNDLFVSSYHNGMLWHLGFNSCPTCWPCFWLTYTHQFKTHVECASYKRTSLVSKPSPMTSAKQVLSGAVGTPSCLDSSYSSNRATRGLVYSRILWLYARSHDYKQGTATRELCQAAIRLAKQSTSGNRIWEIALDTLAGTALLDVLLQGNRQKKFKWVDVSDHSGHFVEPFGWAADLLTKQSKDESVL